VGFFMQTLHAMEHRVDPKNAGTILNAAVQLAARNWAMVHPFFSCLEFMEPEDDFFDQWTLFAQIVADLDIDVAVTFLQMTPEALRILGRDEILSWGNRALRALDQGPSVSRAVRAYLSEAVSNRCSTTPERWEFNLGLAGRIAKVSPVAAEEFIRSGARVCLLLDEADTEKWVDEGLSQSTTPDELHQYFSGKSLKSMDMRDGLITGIALKDRKASLSLIAEAYVGGTVKIRSNRSLVGVNGFSGGAATDGRVVYLPEVVQSFSLFKLMALHQTTLLLRNEWWRDLRKGLLTPTEMHIRADAELLEKLPGTKREMQNIADGQAPLAYPRVEARQMTGSLPWWGEILLDLVSQTQESVRLVKEELLSEHDVPPELLEALLESVLGQGDRDGDSLLARLAKMLENLDFESPDAEELGENVLTFTYKEWDSDLADYKLDWCLVRQRPVPDDHNPFVDDLRERFPGIISLVRRQFARLRPERFRRFRAQNSGDDLDLDALVRAFVDMRSGSFLSDNVYIRRDKRSRDVAVLFLIDLSGSTEEPVHGRRIIDIEKEAMALMAEALDSLGDPFAVYGFRSEGRFRVDLYTVKSFGEPYGPSVQSRLGNLEPGNLTRLGAVIRHGIHKLEDVQAKVKLMVILTDGRPYDLEYGGLDYATADTGRAFKEARQSRIHPFIITSDQKGTTYLKQICSHTQSIILPRVEVLPQVLPALYRRLTA
jgi:Mg-chelatase subunit ChlD